MTSQVDVSPIIEVEEPSTRTGLLGHQEHKYPQAVRMKSPRERSSGTSILFSIRRVSACRSKRRKLPTEIWYSAPDQAFPTKQFRDRY